MDRRPNSEDLVEMAGKFSGSGFRGSVFRGCSGFLEFVNISEKSKTRGSGYQKGNNGYDEV